MNQLNKYLDQLQEMLDSEKRSFNDKYLKSKKQPTNTDDGLVNKSITDVKDSLKESKMGKKCPKGYHW